MNPPEQTSRVSPPTSGTILTGVTILSTLVTVGLSVGNYFLKQRLDAAEARLKERAQAVEESKERIARYDYVYKLLATIDQANASQQTLAINISRLALTPEEQSTLFKGLTFSRDEALAETGRQAVAVITRQQGGPNLALAQAREREGFQFLLDGRYDEAIKAFEDAEAAYPTYHQVYEIARLLRSQRARLGDAASRQAVFRKIVEDYSWGAPQDLLAKIREFSR